MQPPRPAARASRIDVVRPALDVADDDERWILSEENLPESVQHRDATDLPDFLLLARKLCSRRDALVAADLARRWVRDGARRARRAPRDPQVPALARITSGGALRA